jgi:signal peptidase I
MDGWLRASALRQFPRMRRGLEFVLVLVVTIALGGIEAALGGARNGGHTLTPYIEPNSSMEPTLHCARPGHACRAKIADIVLARPLKPGEPKRFDIVVFRTPAAAAQKCGNGGTSIKRIIGLPGETVTEGQGVISVNGRRLIEPYVARWARERDYEGRTWRVPLGRYFVLGDNRAQSCDSREWGALPPSGLIGKAVAVRRGATTIKLPQSP